MGKDPNKRPFRSLIGPKTKPTWQDALVDYTCLYHLLAKKWNGNLSQFIEKMNHAAGTENLFGFHVLNETFDQTFAKPREFEYKFETIMADPEKFKKFLDGMKKKIDELMAAREGAKAPSA